MAERSRSGFEKAMVDFGAAVQKEPRYTDAYAQLAVAYNLMGQYGWMRQDEARSQGRAAAQQALAIDPGQSEARAALGFSYWFYDWDKTRAARELNAALARDPHNVDALHWLAMVLMTTGQEEQAEQRIREALELKPGSSILRTNLGWVHYMEGRYSLAVEELSAVIAHDPDFSSAHYKLASAAYMMGDRRMSWSALETLWQPDAAPAEMRMMHRVFVQQGYAKALEAGVGSSNQPAYGDDVEDARYLMFAGDRKLALQKLHAGLATHDGWMVFVAVDPAFGPLRSDPDFEAIVRQVNSAGS